MEDSKTLDISLEDTKIFPEINPILKSLPKLLRHSNNFTYNLADTAADADNSENLHSCGSVCVYNLKQQLIFNCEFCDLKYGDLDNFKRHLHEAHNLFQLEADPEMENADKKRQSSKVITAVKKEPLEPPIDLPSTYFTEPLVSCGAVFIFNQQKFHLACGYCDCSKYDNLDMFEKHVKQQHNILEGAHNELNVVPKVEVKEEVFLITEVVEPTEVKVEKEELLEEGVLDIKQSYSDDEEEEDEECEDDEENEMDEDDEEFIGEDDEEFIDEDDEDEESEEHETEDEQNTSKATKRKKQESPSDEPSTSSSAKTKRKSKNEPTRVKEKSFECDICYKTFNMRSHRDTHKKRHLGEKNYNCPDCDMKFVSNSELVRHRRVHTGERPYKCDTCDKSFKTNSYLSEHKKVHMGEAAKIYKCEQCGMKFFRFYQFLQHKRNHLSGKSFECDICLKHFPSQKGRKIHKRQQHQKKGERSYECEHCDKKYFRNSELTVHKRVHTGEKPYKCEVCEKNFNSNSSLFYHKKTHMGEAAKIYSCDICDKKFARSYLLFRHKYVHTNERAFECDVCHKYYKSKSVLNVHKKKLHPNETKIA